MTEAEKRKYRVCFTGHRPEKLTRHECQVIKDLEAAIKKTMTTLTLPWSVRRAWLFRDEAIMHGMPMWHR